MSQELLLVDIGNTRIKWGISTGRNIVSGKAFARDTNALENHVNCVWNKISPPDRVEVSNVAGQPFGHEFTKKIQQLWNIPVRFAESAAFSCGIVNGYEDPTQLGVDRWLSMIGLIHNHAFPVCVVNCGTAITMDLINPNGIHSGGLIAPGLNLMVDSLLKGTTLIELNDNASVGFPGRNTTECVNLGMLYASAGMIEKVFRQWCNTLGVQASLVVSGGDAERVRQILSVPSVYEHDLVLQGLLAWSEEQQ